jgi:hypothetical protein
LALSCSGALATHRRDDGAAKSLFSEGYQPRRAEFQWEVTVMSVGERWLLFGIIGGLLPTLLLVRTVLHVLNIPIGRRGHRRP